MYFKNFVNKVHLYLVYRFHICLVCKQLCYYSCILTKDSVVESSVTIDVHYMWVGTTV